MKVVWGAPLEFILTMEGYAVCLAGEGEDGTRAVWERQAYTIYVYVLQEKGENVMRVVWVRQLELEFILTVEGYAVCFAGERGGGGDDTREV